MHERETTLWSAKHRFTTHRRPRPSVVPRPLRALSLAHFPLVAEGSLHSSHAAAVPCVDWLTDWLTDWVLVGAGAGDTSSTWRGVSESLLLHIHEVSTVDTPLLSIWENQVLMFCNTTENEGHINGKQNPNVTTNNLLVYKSNVVIIRGNVISQESWRLTTKVLVPEKKDTVLQNKGHTTKD